MTKLDAGNNDSRKYKMDTIQDRAVYIKKDHFDKPTAISEDINTSLLIARRYNRQAYQISLTYHQTEV